MSVDPATEQPIGEVPVADAVAVAGAVQRARDAQGAWAQRSLSERLAVLERFQRILLDRRGELAELISREAGKPLIEARLAELFPALEMIAYLGREGRSVLSPERSRLDNAMLKDRTSTVGREPVGVVGIIAPWNYPFSIPATQALSALYAGNGVVLKPSEHTPLIGAELEHLLVEAGLPPELLQVVHGPGEPTGEALVSSKLDALLFTGSVATGRAIMAQAGPKLTPVSLELGGKDPMIVCEDANLELAVQGAVWGAFTNAGQTCASVERVYVHQAVSEAFVEGVVQATQERTLGPGLDPDTEIGPLIEPAAVERVEQHVQDAVKQGAGIQAGGQRLPELGARFYAPTVLTDVTHEMRVMTEETFGPVLPIMTVEGDAQAIELANDSPYGLTASIWSQDKRRARSLATRLQAGTVTINDCVYTFAACETPWGGEKSSGVGRTHGRWGLQAVTRIKHVNEARGARSCSPWYYPYDDDLDALGDEGLELLYGRKLQGLKAAGPFLRRFSGKGR